MSALTGPIRLRVSLIYPEIAIFQFGLFFAMIWRGLDYITPPHEQPDALSVVEQALPFPAWGAVLTGIGVLGIAGLHWIRWPITAAAHVLSCAVWAAFAVGSLLSIIERIDHTPSALALATSITAVAASGILVALAEWRGRSWRTAAWALLAATITAAITILASEAGVYGWRTAMDWIFVQAVAHAVLADAAIDVWRDQHHRQEARNADTVP